VLRNPERDTSEARPPRGRGGRGGAGGGGRGRQFDRHSATGRTYFLFDNLSDKLEILQRQLNKLGVMKQRLGNPPNLSPKLIVKKKRRKPMSPPRSPNRRMLMLLLHQLSLSQLKNLSQ